MTTTYEYITIEPLPRPKGRKTDIYAVRNNTGGEILAEIKYYPQWRMFVAKFDPEAVFSASCLRDIQDFLETGAGK